jgi:hypothetical protein
MFSVVKTENFTMRIRDLDENEKWVERGKIDTETVQIGLCN